MHITPIRTIADLANLENCELHRTAAQPKPEGFGSGQVFAKVHFRIHTPAYRLNGHPCFESPQDSDAFYERVYKEISQLGFSCNGQRAERGDEIREELFIHPDDLSGLVAIESIPTILEAIERINGSSLRWIDVYALPELINGEEMGWRLTHYEPMIVERLLRAAKTGRRRDFKMLTPEKLCSDCAGMPGLQFYEDYAKHLAGSLTARRYFTVLIERLEAKGLLVPYKQGNHTYHRAALKGEIKAIRVAARDSYWSLAEKVLSAA